jgi:6-phosphofructokinase 1
MSVEDSEIMKKLDFTIPTLGKPATQSPVSLSNQNNDYVANYVSDDDRVLYDIESVPSADDPPAMLEKAGPRENIYFDPAKVSAAVVTCGGLCPGLNDVIRAIVMTLWYRYGIRKICGIRFGYRGFLPEFNLPAIDLTPESVEDIHRKGGSILGSSRGHGNRTAEIVDSIEQMNLNMLFVIGGDGTQKGALDISNELKKRNLKIAVVGIPKTIDNDISFVQKTFGFETAVSKAVDAVAAAHVEAHDAINGIGVVKVMGRDSGFIAAHTALAINDVNFVLIPEVPFELEGENGLLVHLQKRLRNRNHAVILAAEGAGQGLIAASNTTDASGNKKLSDIGLFLKQEITSHLKADGMEINLKYIDPSYIIRSAPANANDSVYCARLGTNAVHAAMAGKTAMIVSLFNDRFVHVPIEMAVSKKKHINPDEALWRNVIEATGQPALMKNP